MRGFMLKMLACLLAVSCVAVQTADAAQRTKMRKVKGERPDSDTAYSLDDIMKSPKEYIERDVMFYCRFATTSNLFKNINTRFNENAHVNIAVWPDKTVLWEAEGRKNVLPTLYIAKNDPETLDILHKVNKYELIAVTGKVLNVYARYPWILVTKLEKIEKPYDRLSEQVIEHMQSGNSSLKAGNGGAAARHYEQALQFGLPCEYRAKAYEQLAQAYLLENKLDRARGYLRQAVQIERNDPILHLALADVALQMEDPGEALAHAQFALERSGKYPQAYGIKGEALSLLGDYAKAFTELNTAAGTPGITAREKAVVSMRRARIYARSDRYPDAARVYAAISEPGEPLSTDPKLHNEIGLFYEKLFLESGDERYLESASTAFEEAARLASLNPSYLYNQAEVEFRRQRLSDYPDMKKVSDVLEKIFQIDPDYPPARVLQGRVMFQDDRPEDAEQIFQSVAPQLGSNATALLALSEAYIDLGRYGDAHTAVTCARSAEPWNKRVQALGQFLEDVTASLTMASSQSPAHNGYVNGSQNQQRLPSGVGEYVPYNEMQQVPSGEPQPQQEGETTYYYQGEIPPEYQASARKGGARTAKKGMPVVQGQQQRPVGMPAAPAQPAQPQRQAVQPRMNANTLAAAQKMFPDAAPGSLRPPPANSPAAATMARAKALGVTSSGLAGKDSARYPQDIQASVRPSLPAEEEGTQLKRNRYPVTKVQLPESAVPAAQRKAAREVEELIEDEEPVSGKQAPKQKRRGAEPLDLGYTPGGDNLIESRPAKERRLTDSYAEQQDDFNEDFGKDYEWQGRELEAEVDEEGYIRFGMIQGVTGAYASMPVGGMEKKEQPAADGAHIPPSFSFEPDTSPVIIADVRSKAVTGRELPVRNANLYKRYSGGRRPAEIIEREPVSPRLDGDASAMMPPAGDSRPRAEVRLPSSSQGVGMTSDYAPGR